MRYGLLEPTVTQFGSMNYRAEFQGYIKNTIRLALDDVALAHLDDILMYSNSEEEHVEHVEWIMHRLLEAELYSIPEKCEFHKVTVRYLGLSITTKGISMDEDEIEMVRNWSQEKKTKNGRLNNLFKVQQFVRFCNYYQWFISKFSEKAQPLSRLTKKDEPFQWKAEQQLAFRAMVTAFTTAPVLRHFDHHREVIIEADAPDYVSAGVLSQYDNEGVIHPVAYYSRKHTPAECIYDFYDKEHMAISKALEEWRPECEGTVYPLRLITEHQNLEYFMTRKLLNRSQARWTQCLTCCDHQIVYRPGKSNRKVDAVTRRPRDLTEWGYKGLKNMEQVVLKLQNVPELLCLLADTLPDKGRPCIPDHMTQAYETNPLPGTILEEIQMNSGLQEITVAECTENEGRVMYRGNVYLPDMDELPVRIIQEHHDTALAGHPGQANTFDLLDRE